MGISISVTPLSLFHSPSDFSLSWIHPILFSLVSKNSETRQGQHKKKTLKINLTYEHTWKCPR